MKRWINLILLMVFGIVVSACGSDKKTNDVQSFDARTVRVSAMQSGQITQQIRLMTIQDLQNVTFVVDGVKQQDVTVGFFNGPQGLELRPTYASSSSYSSYSSSYYSSSSNNKARSQAVYALAGTMPAPSTYRMTLVVRHIKTCESKSRSGSSYQCRDPRSITSPDYSYDVVQDFTLVVGPGGYSTSQYNTGSYNNPYSTSGYNYGQQTRYGY